MQGRPYVRVFSTASVDGRLADETGYSLLSCRDDFRLQHEVRAWADAVMVGSNTALADDPRLTVRLASGGQPLRVVVDSRLRVPPTARVFSVRGRGVIVTVRGHSGRRLDEYRRRGVIIIEAGEGKVDLAEALRKLRGLGVERLMVEGGGGLIYALLSRGLVDEVWVTIAPYVLGAGPSLANGDKGLWARLILYDYKIVCGGWVSLRYRVLYS